MTDMTIARTILDQIKALDSWALGAWGVAMHPTNKIIGLDDGVRFKTAGMVRWKGFVTITLNGSDLYDIEFARIYNYEKKVDKVVNDIYCDQLVEIINEQVG